MTSLIDSYGGPGSNSYVSLTYADSFLAVAAYNPTVWTSATTLQRGAAILAATRDIEAFTYIGDRYYHDQFLKFPRQLKSRFPYNRTNSTTLSLDVQQAHMLRNVQEATCLQALKIVSEAGQDVAANLIAQGITNKSKRVGPIQESISFGKTNAAQTMRARMSPQAYSLLQAWLTSRRIIRK